jgi:hypothetical protein
MKEIIHDFPEGNINICQICNSDKLDLVHSLGHQPLANTFFTEENFDKLPVNLYPINILKCPNCGLVQIDQIVKQKEVYYPGYPYIPSITGLVDKQQKEFAETCFKKLKLKKGDLVIDIGSNDGNLLMYFQNLGCRVVGVEPTSTYKIANAKGIKTYNNFFQEDIAKKIITEYGKAKLITATNVFAHMSTLGSVMRSINLALDKKSFFVFENHYLDNVIKTLQYDTFYHEHLRTYSAISLKYLFDIYKLNFFDAYKVPRYGGSLRCFVTNNKLTHQTLKIKNIIKNEKKWIFSNSYFKKFSSKIIESKKRLNDKIYQIKNKKQLLVGKACPARAVVLLSYNNITFNEMPYIAEQNTSLKLGKRIPFLNIPIVDSEILMKDKPEYVLLLAWHLKKPIIEKWRKKGLKSKFIIPLPNLEII